MRLPRQTVALLQSACQLVQSTKADAILLMTETDLDWDGVLEVLQGCRLLIVAENRELAATLKTKGGLIVLDIDPGPTPIHERMSLALLEAIRMEHLRTGADVVALYNGILVESGEPEPIDSLSIIHLGEHLERLNSQYLRRLDTQVPLETLRAVVDLATEIGQEGREGHPVGTMFIVGDTRKVLTMATPLNFNPFRGYSREERDVRDAQVREQIKDIAQMEGAILIHRDGVAESACMRIDAAADNITLIVPKGLGTRHWAAAAISRKTKAVAVTVSQSSGTVRIFQNGEVVLNIEALARPMRWGRFRMAHEADGMPNVMPPRANPPE